MNTQRLLSPITAGDGTELVNRVVLAPMTRARAGEARVPNQMMTAYYEQRAAAGLIITEATVVSEQGIGWLNSPGIYNDAQIDGWRRVVSAVHRKGGKVFLQLWHCGRASHRYFFEDERLPVAPCRSREDYGHLALFPLDQPLLVAVNCLSS